MQVVWPWPVQATPRHCHHKPASKIEMGTLEVYEERMTVFVWENYLSHLERVSGSGHFLTKDRVVSLLATTRTVDNIDFTRRVCAALQQDLLVRNDTGLDAEPLSEQLQACLSAVASSSKPATSPFTTHAILHYLAALLVKDLNHHLAHGLDLTATLVQKTLGIQRQWRVVSQLVDALFQTLKGVELPAELPNPPEVLATMLCLPLITCSPVELNNSTSRLANEISRKLEGVASFEARQALFLSLPSHLLCARVADLHLNNFILHRDLNLVHLAQSQSEQLTLQKVACVHLCRTPYRMDGTHDLHYFLHLLLCLLQNFFQQTEGGPVLTCMVPISTPPSPPPPPSTFQTFPLTSHFNIMIDRIAENEAQLEALTSPQCWADIQLIRTFLDHQDSVIPHFISPQ